MSRLHRVLEALRGSAHGEASPRSWRRVVGLCDQLQRWEEYPLALEYLRPLLEGWPDEVRSLTQRDWLRYEYPPPIWPLVQTLRLRMVAGRELGRLEQWCRAHTPRHLSLHTIYGAQDWLVWAPAAREGLRSLALRSCHLRDDRFGAFLDQEWPSLERLNLSGNQLQGERLQELARAAPRLEELNLRGNPLQRSQVEALASAGHPTLRTLRLGQTFLTIEALERLSQGALPSLQQVEMDEVQATDAQRVLWRRYQPVRRGQVVVDTDLKRSYLTESLRAGLLDECTRLRLELWRDTEGLWGAVCGASLPALEALELSQGEGSPSLEALARAPWLGRLKGLVISARGLGDAGAGALVGMEALRGLEELALTQCAVGDAGAVALCQSPWLRGLRRLDLRHNPLGLAGLEAVSRRASGGALEEARVSFHALPDGAGEVVARTPAMIQQAGRARARVSRAGANEVEQLTYRPETWARPEEWLPILEVHAPTRLLIPQIALEEALARALAARRLGTVRHLTLNSTRIEAPALALLLGSAWGRGLEQLTLNYIALTPALAEVLVAWRPTRLEGFSLWHHARSEEPRRLLEGAPWLAALKSLRLPDQRPA
jgi:Leucine-rich repeat (LRR) protein